MYGELFCVNCDAMHFKENSHLFTLGICTQALTLTHKFAMLHPHETMWSVDICLVLSFFLSLFFRLFVVLLLLLLLLLFVFVCTSFTYVSMQFWLIFKRCMRFIRFIFIGTKLSCFPLDVLSKIIYLTSTKHFYWVAYLLAFIRQCLLPFLFYLFFFLALFASLFVEKFKSYLEIFFLVEKKDSFGQQIVIWFAFFFSFIVLN